MRRSIPLRVPERVRVANQLPARDMEVRSVWGMGERVGLWLGEPGARTVRVWPVTGVRPEDVDTWKAAAR